MAKQESVTFVDDIDGGKATETISFALDGAQYEIDLNKKNAAALRKAFAEYVGSGRKVKSSRMTGRRARSSAPRVRVAAAKPAESGSRVTAAKPAASRRRASAAKPAATASDVRQWAQEQGVAVSARGRVSAAVQEQYAQAHA